MTEYDAVNHPKHYVEQSAVLEPIDVLRFAPFDLGNALKYLIRAGHKDDILIDLGKAKKYLNWSIETAHLDVESHNRYLNFFRRYGLFLNKFDSLPKFSYEYAEPIDIFNMLADHIEERREAIEHDTVSFNG